MKEVFVWMQKHDGWKSVMATVYAIICLFDFIVVPSWIGVMRKDLDKNIFLANNVSQQVQIELIKANFTQHDPFTLRGGGMFHLAFGALLTGSALSRRREISENEDAAK